MPRRISTISSSLSSDHFAFKWAKQFFLSGGNSPPVWATLVGGFFLVLSLTLSTFLIFEHLSAYKKPEEQKFLIGVLLMVPCYAVESLPGFEPGFTPVALPS
ncbi:unnamed protein product [Cuscuta campestris]|uniref:Uncharacterized protein n=1 Tax=Cuscuta campestris TaxID=132261 RepID=A0A484M3D3_9ASTE|nr:unnamed protein product [Cuscuta campestris]